MLASPENGVVTYKFYLAVAAGRGVERRGRCEGPEPAGLLIAETGCGRCPVRGWLRDWLVCGRRWGCPPWGRWPLRTGCDRPRWIRISGVKPL